jgi:RNA polymerase sigma-70 factor (ECF subfamily)
MAEPDSLHTTDIIYWVMELQRGRPDAAEPVFAKILTRVERLARGMFTRFPRVGRFVDVDDVVQNSVIRLLNAFRTVRPTSTRHFYALVNTLIRRELLDLAKHYYGPRGHGTNLSPGAIGDGDGEYPAPAAPADDEDGLERMAEFHAAVDGLPVEQREVIGLTYYHGWTLAQVAELFGVSVRTVQRWQDAARETLRGKLVELD